MARPKRVVWVPTCTVQSTEYPPDMLHEISGSDNSGRDLRRAMRKGAKIPAILVMLRKKALHSSRYESSYVREGAHSYSDAKKHKWVIVNGHHRFAAALKLRMKKIPVCIIARYTEKMKVMPARVWRLP